MELSGIHHLTAISGAIQENHRFYTQTLGMRLVKRTVNQDDVSAYHLFYADAKGSPGTRLALIDDKGEGDLPMPWDCSSVPREQQIRGLGPVVISSPILNPTDILLTRVFNMRQVRDCPHPDNPGARVHVFEMGDGGAHAELHVAVQPDLPVAQQGAGGVHHVAFRSRDSDYEAWADRLNEFGIPNSGKVDRFWFRSLYVREPNGVLFEIATDGPGFGIDEDLSTLGEQLVLPPFLEPHRNQIAANLEKLD